MNVYHIYLHKKLSLPKVPIVACIGYFDGLHRGHQKLIETVLRQAAKLQAEPALITFEPDPWAVLKGLRDIPHITPMPHRMELGEAMGIKHWIMLHFDREMAALPPSRFHEQILKKLPLTALICGYDFHYACKGEGSVETLRQGMDCQLWVVDEVSSDHHKISSTRIEELLTAGKVQQAAALLGRPYEMRGTVKKGRMVGRKHGFATANLQLQERYLPVAVGVYAGEVKVHGRWHGAMINVGHNPTYNYQREISIEAHILDFDEDIYDACVCFRFHAYLRAEQQFANAEALGVQLAKDLVRTRRYLQARKEQSACD